MPLICRTLLGGLLLTFVLAACTDSTASRLSPAVFALRSINGQPLPAAVAIGGARQVVVADTLLVGVAPSGVLRRTAVGGLEATPPKTQRSEHDYVWRDQDLLVFFGCASHQPCVAILSFERGTLLGRELRFEAQGPFVPERVYERVR